MNRNSSEHIRRNKHARAGWEPYATHRRHVTQLLASLSRSPRDRLCVLGEGNCNDLDLETLGKSFRTVHLVDLDSAALEFGMDQQQPSNVNHFRRHGSVDVTGLASLLGNWSPQNPPGDAQLQEFLAKPLPTVVPGLPEPCEVVASVGLFTQLLDSIALAIGSSHPAYLNLVQSVRLQHTRQLVQLLQPGGKALLVTEVVSSDTFPGLATIPDNELAAAISAQINRRNFFTGTNPVVLRALLQSDAVTAPFLSDVTILPPWKWQFIERLYAVVAILMSRKQAADD